MYVGITNGVGRVSDVILTAGRVPRIATRGATSAEIHAAATATRGNPATRIERIEVDTRVIKTDMVPNFTLQHASERSVIRIAAMSILISRPLGSLK